MASMQYIQFLLREDILDPQKKYVQMSLYKLVHKEVLKQMMKNCIWK